MGNEKYVNYYVEILTNTLNDAIIRNVSLQANAKVSEDVINGQVKKLEEVGKYIDNLKNESQSVKDNIQQAENQKIINLENTIKGHLDTIAHLQKQLTELNVQRDEFEKVKHQVQHVDTFRNELVKTQKVVEEKNSIIQSLNEKIEYLQLTPAKRKKIDDVMNPSKTEETNQPQESQQDIFTVVSDEIIKDGGSF